MFIPGNKPHEFDGRDTGGLEFIPGMLRGSRSWDVSSDGALLGLFYKQPWLRGINQAYCLENQDHKPDLDYTVPLTHDMETCKHGLYAYYNGSNDWHVKPSRAFKSFIEGMVENDGYGEVLVGRRGFRCMKARIVALSIDMSHITTDLNIREEKYILDSKLERLVRMNYRGIPIFDSFEKMIEEFPQITLEDEANA